MSIAPQGFRFAVAAAGFRKENRPDLALLVSDVPAVAAGTFTQNRFPAAPVVVAKAMLAERPEARAVVINSGQANACTGDEGMRNCRLTLELVGRAAGLDPSAVLPASTGVIGAQLKMDLWEKAAPVLAANLGQSTPEDFASAIMTTDAFPKLSHREVALPGGVVRLVGMAKGAGMICPNMATMLSVVLCDAEVEASLWQKLLREAVDQTFNRVTVDGDTSTNDTLYGLTNGASGVAVADGESVAALSAALVSVLGDLAYMLVQDGEGASKVARIHVTGARSDADAERVARTVGHSQLVKTALYGRDANWGRIVAAVGRSGAEFEPEDVRVSLCGVELFRNGQPTDLDFDALLEEPLKRRDLPIDIILGAGPGSYTLLASDLGHEYVNVNADYRS
ncbi:MAG TPA: bifunctional glutamate N-acetyltransferase/amino-acid acetyltransferase ArgJ [Candidatus Bilophila faecipullorum]|uniref:Arginine biosynthesis bifunctional protein ArgJ n=1 Tax=Candidatus Bilophila faecipullorum TaxID=2838482 RepID=A0A9D1U9F1_9BACT|nr:bifunctional glutamate N-acetyltransferase/amino-acid acetyltransferase ArgJ [uncultured Bilophila sp.]HIW78421.1 bifunctional glutamate N-acetyltransferase/amino-acid acetyltransferase ArgJ [Candidatus Bilophila faecipullorum]